MKISLRKNKLLISTAGIILILTVFNLFQKEVKGFFYWFSAPVQEVFWGAGESSSDFLEGIIKIGSLKNELDILEQQNQELLVQLVNSKTTEEENRVLRWALDAGLNKELKLSFASIISKSPSEDLIFINRGSESGLKEGMPVITKEKILVGKTGEVYRNYAEVSLISSKDMSFDIKVYKEEKEISAIAKGRGRNELLLELIPREENLSEGDAVFTNCLGGVFPESLLIGRITEVISKDTESFQSAKVKPAFNLEENRHLFVITDF